MRSSFIIIKLYFVLTIICGLRLDAQNQISLEVLTFEEYIAFVKQYHPLTKQANLTLTLAEANLLKARGGFDPKVMADYDRKKFKDVEYYDKLNAAFKIPTWFGVEVFGEFEENTGVFLNPENSLPENGLFSAGVSLSLARGLLANERMADLRQARFFLEESKARQSLLVNDVIYEATLAYLDWVRAKREVDIYVNVLDNALLRLNSVVRTVREGQEAPIDSTEAKINFQTRQLGLEMATLVYQKAKLRASNYLWINDIPIEIEESVDPSLPTNFQLTQILDIQGSEVINIDTHPKLVALDNKINANKVEVNLKRNNLLPTVDLKYNFLSSDYDQINAFNTNNYKAQLNFRLPLFLRKERGEFAMAKAKLQNIRFDRANAEIVIKNKIDMTQLEIMSLIDQNLLMEDMVNNYQTMLRAEERKFSLGESSLFLVNSREQKYIDAQLKQNELNIKSLEATAKLYNVLGEIGNILQ